jgi:hypothetical protein
VTVHPHLQLSQLSQSTAVERDGRATARCGGAAQRGAVEEGKATQKR